MVDKVKNIIDGKVSAGVVREIMWLLDEDLSNNRCDVLVSNTENVITKIEKPVLKYLAEQHVFIQSVAGKKIVFGYMDYMNNQSVDAIAKAYWLADKAAKQIWEINKISFNVYTFNERAAANIEKYCVSRFLDPKSLKLSKYTPMESALSRRGYPTSILENLIKDIVIVDVNIDKYLSN